MILAKNDSEKKFDSPIFDGLYKRNTVFVSGLVIAPVIISANTVAKAIALVFAFSAITFLTIMISSFISRSIVYTIRIILYTIIAALVYVPVISIELQLFPKEVEKIGIIMPLLIVNSLIVSKTELRFFRRTKGKMLIDVVSSILGFDIAILIFAFVREILGTGSISGKILGIPLTFPVLVYPFGGFILLGLMAAILRKIQFSTSE